MKTVPKIASLLSLVLVFVAAGPSFADDKREEKPRFKGVELYSWKGEGDQWRFVMLNGTNRLKATDEVKKAKGQLEGAAALKEAFKKLAKGEQVFWSHMIKGFEFPPKELRKELAAAAQEADIELSVGLQDQ